MKILRFGDHDEILIVRERIVSVAGVPDYDRAGNVVMKINRDTGGVVPAFVSSMVSLDSGNSIEVPHSPNEVLRRMLPEPHES